MNFKANLVAIIDNINTLPFESCYEIKIKLTDIVIKKTLESVEDIVQQDLEYITGTPLYKCRNLVSAKTRTYEF